MYRFYLGVYSACLDVRNNYYTTTTVSSLSLYMVYGLRQRHKHMEDRLMARPHYLFPPARLNASVFFKIARSRSPVLPLIPVNR